MSCLMCVCWKPNPGSLQKEYALNIEPSVHPQIVYSHASTQKTKRKNEIMYLKLLWVTFVSFKAILYLKKK